MLSIKKLLDEERVDHAPACAEPEPIQKLAQMIVQAIALHAVEFDRIEVDRFRAQMERFGGRLDRSLDATETLVLAGSLTEALLEYNARVSQFLNQRGLEYRGMVNMLSEAIAEMSGGCDQTICKLKSIEGQMSLACEIDDIREVRSQLGNCLTELRVERARQEEQAAPSLQALQKRVSEAAAISLADPEIDPCTGLPSRALAERALAEPAVPGTQRFAAIFVVDRVQLVNLRFGGQVGDEILLTFAQQLAQGLSGSDRCYRWSGPALLAILERTHPLVVVRSEIARLLPAKVEKTFRVGSRSVLIPVSSTWTVAPLQGRQLRETLLKLDSFVTEHAPEPQGA